MNVGLGSNVLVTPLMGPDMSGASGTMSEGSSADFGAVLKGAINSVSNLQSNADQQLSTIMQGGQGDMSKTMISLEKADVAFQLMLQVRNKVVSAYQDIEKMQF